MASGAEGSGGEGDAPPAEPVATPKPGSPQEFVENKAPARGVAIKAEPFDPGKWREAARVSLAGGLFLLLALTVLIIQGAVVWGHLPIDTAQGLFQTLLAPLIGLVGAATGFYFGGKDK